MFDNNLIFLTCYIRADACRCQITQSRGSEVSQVIIFNYHNRAGLSQNCGANIKTWSENRDRCGSPLCGLLSGRSMTRETLRKAGRGLRDKPIFGAFAWLTRDLQSLEVTIS